MLSQIYTTFSWDDEDAFFIVKQFAKFTGVPNNEGLKLSTKQNWPKGSSIAFTNVFPPISVKKKSQNVVELPLSL